MTPSVSVRFLNSAQPDVFVQKLGTHSHRCALLRKDVDFGVRLVCVPVEALATHGVRGPGHVSLFCASVFPFAEALILCVQPIGLAHHRPVYAKYINYLNARLPCQARGSMRAGVLSVSP